jgi:hypothetical protein
MTSCQENVSILTDGTFIQFYFFKNQERDTVELVRNLCLSCKEVYDSDNITAEQQDVNDNNFCPACWEQLKRWDVSKNS